MYKRMLVLAAAIFVMAEMTGGNDRMWFTREL